MYTVYVYAQQNLKIALTKPKMLKIDEEILKIVEQKPKKRHRMLKLQNKGPK